MKPLSIGTLAREAGVGIEAIRFYEREGLLPEPPRKPSGYRQYSGDAVERLRFIRRAKELGFSLQEIKELFSLRVAPGTTCQEVKQRAEAKVSDIEERIRSLQKMKRALARLAAACRGRGPVSECPILDALGDGFGQKAAGSLPVTRLPQGHSGGSQEIKMTRRFS